MELKRLLAGAAATAATAVVMLPSTAAAQVSDLSVSPQTVEAGHDITITGSCGDPSADVSMWYGKLDSIGEPLVRLEEVSSGQDSISGTITITAGTPPGPYLAVMQCGAQAGELGTVGFNVAAGGTEAGGGATAEGVDFILFAAGGMLLAAAIAGTFYYRHNERA